MQDSRRERGGAGWAGLTSLLGDRNLLWAILVSVIVHALLFVLPLRSPRPPAQPVQALLVSLEPATAPAPVALAERPPPAAIPARTPQPAQPRREIPVPAAPSASDVPHTEAPPTPAFSTGPPISRVSSVEEAADPAPDGDASFFTAPGSAGSVVSPEIRKSPVSAPAADRDRLLAELRRAITRALAYPLSARRRGVQGEVVIGLILEPSGEARSLDIRQSSGSPTLDRAALKAVRHVLPFPTSLPQPLSMEIPVAFRLSD